MASIGHLEFAKFWILACWVLTVIGVNSLLRRTKFYQNRWFFTEIKRSNYFQNVGYPPSWIFEIYHLCHTMFVNMRLCFPPQNFTQICLGLSAAELWPKTMFLPTFPFPHFSVLHSLLVYFPTPLGQVRGMTARLKFPQSGALTQVGRQWFCSIINVYQKRWVSAILSLKL